MDGGEFGAAACLVLVFPGSLSDISFLTAWGLSVPEGGWNKIVVSMKQYTFGEHLKIRGYTKNASLFIGDLTVPKMYTFRVFTIQSKHVVKP